MPNTFDEAVREAAAEVAEIVIRKQRDYGKDNILNGVVSPELGIAVRLSDKVHRLANLVESGAEPEHESLIDTSLDIIGYGLILNLLLTSKFQLPMEDKESYTAIDNLTYMPGLDNHTNIVVRAKQ